MEDVLFFGSIIWLFGIVMIPHALPDWLMTYSYKSGFNNDKTIRRRLSFPLAMIVAITWPLSIVAFIVMLPTICLSLVAICIQEWIITGSEAGIKETEI